MCGTVCCGFVGVSVCCVLESLVWVCGRECVLCVGQFVDGLWVCGNECVGQFRVGLWE